jgi:hypothetical protein
LHFEPAIKRSSNKKNENWNLIHRSSNVKHRGNIFGSELCNLSRFRKQKKVLLTKCWNTAFSLCLMTMFGFLRNLHTHKYGWTSKLFVRHKYALAFFRSSAEKNYKVIDIRKYANHHTIISFFSSFIFRKRLTIFIIWVRSVY